MRGCFKLFYTALDALYSYLLYILVLLFSEFGFLRVVDIFTVKAGIVLFMPPPYGGIKRYRDPSVCQSQP